VYIYPSHVYDMGVGPFDGAYPSGWPSQITVPPDTVLFWDGSIHEDPYSPGSFELCFTYGGDVAALQDVLQGQAAAAGYTEENETWTKNMDYGFVGMGGFVRIRPGTQQVFSYYVQTFQGNPHSIWQVMVSTK